MKQLRVSCESLICELKKLCLYETAFCQMNDECEGMNRVDLQEYWAVAPPED